MSENNNAIGWWFRNNIPFPALSEVHDTFSIAACANEMKVLKNIPLGSVHSDHNGNAQIFDIKN